MKFILAAFFALALILPSSAFAGQHPYKKHPGCNQVGYTCVLKVVDGSPFYCLKTISQRAKNVRNHPRKVRQIKCVDRFPAIPNEPEKEEEDE